MQTWCDFGILLFLSSHLFFIPWKILLFFFFFFPFFLIHFFFHNNMKDWDDQKFFRRDMKPSVTNPVLRPY